MVVVQVSSRSLSFVPHSLKVLHVLTAAEGVIIRTVPRSLSAKCPDCGTASRRVHSRYRRSLCDLPWQGRRVTISVAARRFRCVDLSCTRLTFAERFGDVARSSGRRTGRLHELQRYLGLALGGEAGARLAARLATPTSPDTLLRLASSAAPPVPKATPRVVGIDDWAWRRGRQYGSVLVDLEKNEVVDLLPDREATTVAAWLRDHPGVQIVARDRAGAYGEGIRQGAPNAIQVADRWHLLRNLGEAVQALGERHNAAARRAAEHVRTHLALTQAPLCAPSPAPASAIVLAAAAPSRRQAQCEEAVRLHAAGATITRISAELGIDRKTVRGWLRIGRPPPWRQPSGDSILDPYATFLGRRWSEGCRNAARLWRELRDLGFRGRPSVVRDWAARHRGFPEREGGGGGPLPPTWPTPAGYRLARLLTTRRSRMTAEERIFVTRLLADQPELGAAVTWAKRLSRLLRQKATDSLEDVLAAGAGTLLRRFATSLRRDYDAINAALSLPWTTSPVEGQISRIKMIKRTMYGRAGFELLRARVLHAT